MGTLLLTVVSIALMLGSWAVRRRHRRGPAGRGVVVPRYDVPRSLPPILAAVLVERPRSPRVAQLLHLAVTGVVSIRERRGAVPGGRTARHGRGRGLEAAADRRHELRLLPDPGRLDALDVGTVRMLFPDARPGAAVVLEAQPTALASGFARLAGDARDRAVERGLVVRARSPLAIVLAVLALASAIVSFVAAGAEDAPTAIGVLLFFVVLAACAGLVGAAGAELRPTERGAAVRDHLLGARDYMRLAEADRIRMLQSYSGAERRRDGSVDVVRLYERLLPYAVLFGIEREWARALSLAYASTASSAGGMAGGDPGPAWFAPVDGWAEGAFADAGALLDSIGESFADAIDGFADAVGDVAGDSGGHSSGDGGHDGGGGDSGGRDGGGGDGGGGGD